jgi:hypothetical protein
MTGRHGSVLGTGTITLLPSGGTLYVGSPDQAGPQGIF